MLTDPIADLLTRIRNGLLAGKVTVACPSSRLKERICTVLQAQGYIGDFHREDDTKQGILRINLRYVPKDLAPNGRAIQGIKRVSKPGRRVYCKHAELPRVLNGLGVAIMSTSQGVMTDREARKKRVGGEHLCSVW
jgi:small subunit ribosomal protein S8